MDIIDPQQRGIRLPKITNLGEYCDFAHDCKGINITEAGEIGKENEASNCGGGIGGDLRDGTTLSVTYC